MQDWVPLCKREEWKDVEPLKEYSESVKVGKIAYSEQFNEILSYFRRILVCQEHSVRSYDLSTELLSICPGYYTAWYFRGIIISVLSLDLIKERAFLNDLSIKNPKNYQIWSYRRELLKKINQHEGEIEFLNIILDLDAKNIHAWGYRQWLVAYFSLWSSELDYVGDLISKDSFNNSAWSQKKFIEDHLSLSESRNTLDYVLSFCENIHNECPYNYLKSLYSAESGSYIKSGICSIILKNGWSRIVLTLLVFIYEKEGNKEMQVAVIKKLQEIDFMRTSFWVWREKNIIGNNITRTYEDRQICRMLSVEGPTNVMFEFYKRFLIIASHE